MIQPPQSDDPYPDGDIGIQRGENHTAWTFTRNIIYDTFQGTNHSVYHSTSNTIAPFTNNVYYNPYGTQLLSGPQQRSFEEWQKTGQYNGSVMARVATSSAFCGKFPLFDHFSAIFPLFRVFPLFGIKDFHLVIHNST